MQLLHTLFPKQEGPHWIPALFGGTHPADGTEALVDSLVPETRGRVLVFGRQSFGASMEICS